VAEEYKNDTTKTSSDFLSTHSSHTYARTISLSFSSFPHLFTWKRNDNRRVRSLDWLIERNGKNRRTHAGSDGEARDFWRRDSISSILHISRVFCYLWVVARSPNEGQDGATVVWRSKKRRTKRGKEATYLFWYKKPHFRHLPLGFRKALEFQKNEAGLSSDLEEKQSNSLFRDDGAFLLSFK